MTQKELSYVEDAIGHEKNIIKIINNTTSNLQDENLISFMNEELNTHNNMLEKLMHKLEEKTNEWSTTYG